jgi:uncharacterized protein YndB with AHSA1/START domain
MTDTANNPDGDSLIIERVFNASRDLVWKAWTDPRYVSRWWGPKGFSAPHCAIDVRVGGRILLCMRSPDGKDYWNAGEFREIVALERIVWVLWFSDKDGRRQPPSHYGFGSDFPNEMVDQLTFQAIGPDTTMLTLRRNHSVSIAERYGEIQGWNQSLDRFATILADMEQAQ